MSDPEFTPQYKEITPRERKIREMYGDTVKIAPQEPADFSKSAKPLDVRKKVSELVPANQPWSTAEKSTEDHSAVAVKPYRKEKSELLSATQSWAIPQPGPSAAVENPRRVDTGLIPTSMPWAVPLGHRHDPVTSTDCRRKKIPIEPSSMAQVLGGTPHSGTQHPHASDLIISVFQLENVPEEWNQATITRMLCAFGLHVVSVIIKTDFFSDDPEGVADVHIRHLRSEETSILELLRSKLSKLSVNAFFLTQ